MIIAFDEKTSCKLLIGADLIISVFLTLKPFDIEFYRLRKSGGNWFMLDAQNNEVIQQLADEIIVNLNKNR